MSDREVREWLGITLADALVYIAAAALTVMFFVSSPVGDAILAVLGVVFTIAACPFGMKRDPEVSNFTNGVKLVAYPVCVLLAIGAIVAHYVWFNS